MKYSLFFKELELAEIEQTSSDFPNLSGRYKLSSFDQKENQLLTEYINYSIKASVLMEEDEKEWLKLIETEEDQFIDFIESEDWNLIDKNGDKHPILIPIFCANSEIIWRWSF